MISTQMMNQALRYLSQGNCSEFMLCVHLEEDFAGGLNLKQRIQETIWRLNQLDLINDARIARRMAERYRHKGDNFIIKQLEDMGIKNVHVQSALAFIGNEYQRALFEAQLKCNNYEESEILELQNQIMRLLSSRAFTYQTLKRVMDTLFSDNILINPLNIEQERDMNKMHTEN
ncbi:MAG: RecX family transcriptional regulator [Legionella sp.]|nr:RecX family transcriptional regulator [Legionella sp.]